MPKQFDQGFSGLRNPNLTSELKNSQVVLHQNIIRSVVSLQSYMPASQNVVFPSSILVEASFQKMEYSKILKLTSDSDSSPTIAVWSNFMKNNKND